MDQMPFLMPNQRQSTECKFMGISNTQNTSATVYNE